jgi:hypothetical protein
MTERAAAARMGSNRVYSGGPAPSPAGGSCAGSTDSPSPGRSSGPAPISGRSARKTAHAWPPEVQTPLGAPVQPRKRLMSDVSSTPSIASSACAAHRRLPGHRAPPRRRPRLRPSPYGRPDRRAVDQAHPARRRPAADSRAWHRRLPDGFVARPPPRRSREKIVAPAGAGVLCLPHVRYGQVALLAAREIAGSWYGRRGWRQSRGRR